MAAGGAEEEGGVAAPKPKLRDIRRYFCEYCGICRSKKSLISAHIQSHHQEEMKEREMDGSDDGNKADRPRSYDCEECSASFRKPAYLKQHMQSHSLVELGLLIDENHVKNLDIWREALDPT